MTRTLQKQQYAFLSVYEETTELIVVKDGRYDAIYYLNMGTQLLKACYKEHDIEKYFYAHYADIVDNQFLSQLVDKAVSFFVLNLCEWMYQYIDNDDNVVIG